MQGIVDTGRVSPTSSCSHSLEVALWAKVLVTLGTAVPARGGQAFLCRLADDILELSAS